ncbi:hypothetical protein CVV43_03785 [Candidatus Saccharibacteria bacterium HGW-Saccharibacteria-1]|jgi:type II secretory pathway pseudopilin PulG|nr:MAG: hypothetical protein CVV43_03785 [Candidatus Saccharibacteria bacterium HGW-Saccharibacteria-1]
MNQQNSNKGFTLVELMLAMGFLSALMIIIAMTVVQIGNIYNKGITLKEVNLVGKAISTELQHSIIEVASFDLSAKSYIVQKDVTGNAIGGRLCTGKYTYIWNNGTNIEDNNFVNKYVAPVPATSSPIHLIKILDANKSYCVPVSFGVYSDIPLANASELIVSDKTQLDLAILGFSVNSNSSAYDSITGERLYNIRFTLGTNKKAARITDPTTHIISCRPPSDFNSDFNFCSVNDFDIVARAGNKIK